VLLISIIDPACLKAGYSLS